MRNRCSNRMIVLMTVCMMIVMMSVQIIPSSAVSVSFAGAEVSVATTSVGSGETAVPATVEAVLTSDEAGFKDVQNPEAFYYDPVYWAVEQGVTTGTSEDTFSPDGKCTRGHIVTFLWRLNGEPKVEKASGFTDVQEKAYYAKAVDWAVELGITTGTSSTTFSPEDVCTRAQIVTFLYRLDGQPDVSGKLPFSDVKDSDYFAMAVNWAVQTGVTSGTSKTTFSPQDHCTRAQAVTFIHRYFQRVTAESHEEIEPEDSAVTFTCDPDYIPAGIQKKVRFYAGGVSGEDVQAVPSDGSDADAVVLNDEGEAGDVEAGDGIYTGSARVKIAENQTSEFYLIADGKKQASLTIHTYTEEDFERSQETISSISQHTDELVSEYLDWGSDLENLPDPEKRAQALQETSDGLGQYLDIMKNNGEVLSWSEDSFVFTVNLPAGICVVPLQSRLEYANEWEGGMNSENRGSLAVAELSSDNSDGTQSLIASIEPFYLEGVTNWHDDSAQLIQDSIEGFRFASTVDNDYKTKFYQLDSQPVIAAQAMNFYRDQLDDYNVIIWNGHGTYSTNAGVFLYSGVYYSDLVEELYANDLASGRLYWAVLGSGKNNIMYGLTGGFFQYHYKMNGHRLNDSLVYLGACHSGEYGGVCRSFITCGAKAAIGFDNAVHKSYEALFVEDFFKALIKKNPITGKSATVTSAFNTAVFKNKAAEKYYQQALPYVDYAIGYVNYEKACIDYISDSLNNDPNVGAVPPAPVKPGKPTKPVLFKASGPDYRLTDYAYHAPDKIGPNDEKPEPSEGCVFFGHYFQSMVTDDSLKTILGKMTRDSNGELLYNGVRYKYTGGNYFREDPIEWIILNEGGGSSLLLSKKILAFRDFGGENFWHECALRTWLNGEFCETAFTEAEQSVIETSTLSTWYHPYQDAYIDHNPATYVTTEDKVWLLDMNDVQSAEYGFTDDASRKAQATAFADKKEAFGRWWIRGNARWNYGNLQERFVNANGEISSWYGTYSYGVRPAIRIRANASDLLED